MADRLPVGKYIVAYHIIDFAAMAETSQKLESNLPKVIVFSEREDQDFPSLRSLLAAKYVPVSRFEDLKVYFRMDNTRL